MFSIKAVLIKAITLMFRESQLKDPTIDSRDWIREIINTYIQISDSNLTLDHSNRILFNVKEIAIKMTRDNKDTEYSIDALNQDLKIACENDHDLYGSIMGALVDDLDRDKLLMYIRQARASIESEVNNEKLRNILKTASATLLYKGDTISSYRDFVTDLVDQISPFQTDLTVEENRHVVARVNFNNLEGMAKSLDRVSGEADGSLTIKTPWKAINRMLAGGLRRRQTMVTGALRHNYKTGMAVDLAIGACVFNDPKPLMDDPEKKPLVLYITAEDEEYKIIGTIFQRLYENFENKEMDSVALGKINAVEAAQYIHEKMTANVYYFELLKVNPGECTYRDIIDIVQDLELQGYEIHVCVIDYLNMLSKKGCRNGVVGEDIQDLFNKMRNFFSNKNIAFITPHQLSSDAENENRNGRAADLVNIVSNGSYYAGARGIGREVDLEVYCHIVKDSGQSYLTIRRGKHRVVAQTPEKYLYTILPFKEIGGLRYDVNTEFDTSLTKIGAVRNESGEEIMPFWD